LRTLLSPEDLTKILPMENLLDTMNPQQLDELSKLIEERKKQQGNNN
jgi:hypothetical protein